MKVCDYICSVRVPASKWGGAKKFQQKCLVVTPTVNSYPAPTSLSLVNFLGSLIELASPSVEVVAMVELPNTLSPSCRPPGNFSCNTFCNAMESTSGSEDAMTVSVPSRKRACRGGGD